jgi:2-dehydropantoate 2-reductase
VGKGAVVYTFQNGVESTERIGRVVGPGAVVPGVARIAAHIIEPGVIRQAGNFARIDFAEADSKPSARTAAFHKACRDAGIDANLCPNIGRELWMKFAMLAPHAAMTALTRGPIGPVRSNPKSRALLQSLVEETVAVGAALKTGVGPDDAAKVMQGYDAMPKGFLASMAHDILAGKPIEVEHLSGVVVRLGRESRVPTPSHTFITQALAPFADGKPQV